MTVTPSTRFRSGAVLLGLYALLLVGNAAVYAAWSGDLSGLTPRFWGRVAFVLVLIYGLWQSTSWARWLTVAFGSVFGALGLFGLWVAQQTGLFEERPYPMFDYTVLAVTSFALLAAAAILLLPSRVRHRGASSTG